MWGFLLLLFAGLETAHAGARFHATVIYGEDHRQDIYDVRDARWVKAAESVALIVPFWSVRSAGEGYELSTQGFGESEELCRNERFYHQPSVSGCSAVLVGSDLMLTAGHCMRNSVYCYGTRIAFNFAYHRANQRAIHLTEDDVYSCSEIVVSYLEDERDFTLFRLDRPAKGRRPLPVRGDGGSASNGEPLVMIGHPAGLPTKVVGGAQVRSQNRYVLLANLDSSAGNSGSPVFNAGTGLIEGILTGGEDDYAETPQGCYASKRCPDEGCSGETVLKSSVFNRYIK